MQAKEISFVLELKTQRSPHCENLRFIAAGLAKTTENKEVTGSVTDLSFTKRRTDRKRPEAPHWKCHVSSSLSHSDLPPKTEQSIEPVQRHRQRGRVGSFHDHFRGSVVSEKCFTGFDNQASVVQVISVSKKKKNREISGL